MGSWRTFLADEGVIHLVMPDNYCLTCGHSTHPAQSQHKRADEAYQRTPGYQHDAAFSRLLDFALPAVVAGVAA